MESKSIFLSKTFWTQVIMGGLTFIPVVKDYVTAHPDLFIYFFGAVNVLLRLITKGSVFIS